MQSSSFINKTLNDKQNICIMVTRNRILDIAKGIGIILVVIGHMPINIDIYNVIYTFHVPLFFFISGLLYRPLRDMPFNKYLMKISRKTLFPIVLFGIVFICVCIYKASENGNITKYYYYWN